MNDIYFIFAFQYVSNSSLTFSITISSMGKVEKKKRKKEVTIEQQTEWIRQDLSRYFFHLKIQYVVSMDNANGKI